MGELVDMPFRMFHSLYRAAWQESEARRIEAEMAEKEAMKEQQKQQSAGNRNRSQIDPRMSSREAFNSMRGMSADDLDDVADELGSV